MSASLIALIAFSCAKAYGSKNNFLIFKFELCLGISIFVSPLTISPFSNSAHRLLFSSVTGKTFPLTFRILHAELIPSSSVPVIFVKAVKIKLPIE